MPEAWNYFAMRLNGDGTETNLRPDIQLVGVKFSDRLSGYNSFSATVLPSAVGIGGGWMLPWSTAIYASYKGQIRGGWIVTDVMVQGDKVDISGIGFAGYLDGLPWDDTITRIGIDCRSIIQHIWATVQSKPYGNIGLDIPTFPLTGVLVGTKDQPWNLNWWENKDCSREFLQAIKDGGLDFRETHAWNGDRTAVTHTLTISKAVGRRQNGLRFVEGENIFSTPKESFGDEWASQYIVLGAGEGRKMVRSWSPIRGGRLRRPRYLVDKRQTKNTGAQRVAIAALKATDIDGQISDLTIVEHPNAPIGSFNPGDQILVTIGDGALPRHSVWVRITAITYEPAKPEAVSITVEGV